MSGILENTHMKAAYLDTSFNFIWVNAPTPKRADTIPNSSRVKTTSTSTRTRRTRPSSSVCGRYRQALHVEAKPFEFPDQPERGVTYWTGACTPWPRPGEDDGPGIHARRGNDRIRLKTKCGSSPKWPTTRPAPSPCTISTAASCTPTAGPSKSTATRRKNS